MTARWRLPAAALGGYLALAVLLTHHLWGPGRAPASNVHDFDLFSWLLAGHLHSVTHLQNPFVLHGMNAPEGFNAMWNNAMLLPSTLLLPVTALAGSTASVVVLLTLGPALTAWAAYLVLGRWVDHTGARLLGGLVAGFSPALVHQSVGHPDLTFAPLVVWLLAEYVDLLRGATPPRRAGLRIGLLAAAQLLTGEELLVQAVAAAAIGTVVAAASRPRWAVRRLRSLAVGGGFAAAAFVPLAAYPLWVQLLGPLRQHGSSYTRDYFKNDLLSFVTPGPLEVLHTAGSLVTAGRFRGGIEEQGAYLGIPLLVLLLVVLVVRWRDLRVRVPIVTAMVLAAVSLGEHPIVNGREHPIALPWHYLHALPVVSSALVGRLSITIGLLLGAVLAAVVDWAPTGRPTVRYAAIAAAVVSLVPWLPHAIPATVEPPVPAYFTSNDVRDIPEGSTVLVVPWPTGGATDPLRWQVAAGLRYDMPGGYFQRPSYDRHAIVGPLPRRMSDLLQQVVKTGIIPTLTPQDRSDIANDFRFWRATTVVLGPCDQRPSALVFLTALLGRPPVDVGGVSVWYDVTPPAG